MTEDEAQRWIAERYGSDTVDRVAHYVALLAVENDQQNLIASSTVDTVWARHIVDSAQLLDLAPPPNGAWLDIGSGAGLPGLVVAMMSDWHVHMVEPRRLRVEFLRRCIEELGLSRATVTQAKIANVGCPPATVISARAVAALPQLIASAAHLADADTVWVLPKGSRAQSEVADTKRTWQGVFHVKPSVVDPDSGIVVASNIAAKER